MHISNKNADTSDTKVSNVWNSVYIRFLLQIFAVILQMTFHSFVDTSSLYNLQAEIEDTTPSLGLSWNYGLFY